jgi:hypothetical protein
MYILIIILVTLVALHFLTKPRESRESYENYDETTCLALAQKNQANIESLQTDINTLLALQSKLDSIQATTDSNTKQLSSLVDQVYKTPS